MDFQETDAEPLRIYLDDQEEPFKEEVAPLRFNFNTIQLADGPHTLRIEASNGLAPPTIRKIEFEVRNGVAVTVSGLEPGQTVSGQRELIINAYAGNSEVDFEPRKAETPQPIPTWSWVLFLSVIAWTMFYLLNPKAAPAEAVTTHEGVKEAGRRLYVDTCARCHGERGEGRERGGEAGGAAVPPLLDNTRYALADTPLDLLLKVVLGGDPGASDLVMPTWGPILTNDEIVGVVNHVRTSWRHDASTIDFEHHRPPAEIEDLEKRLSRALKMKKADRLAQCCWPDAKRPPVLYRTDGVRAESRDEVREAWESYFEDLGEGGITQFKLTERRFDYEPATVNQDGSIVIGVGRIFLEAKDAQGNKVSEKGRFIRVYQLSDGNWSILLDFADIPMRVGCEPGEPDCPIEIVPASGNGGQHTNTTTTNGNTGETTTPTEGAFTSYAQVQQALAGLGYDASRAPHGNFWELSYKDFMALRFGDERGKLDPELPYYQLVTPGDVENSNFIRAFEGRDLIMTDPGSGETWEAEIARMPKNKDPLDPKLIAALKGWVAAGCPENDGDAGAPAAGNGDAGGGTPPPAPVATGDGALGHAEAMKLLADLGIDASRAPHGNFWELPYAEFLALRFGDERGKLDPDVPYYQLVTPGDAENSNFIRAFEGRDLIMTDPESGDTWETEVARMPKNKEPLDPTIITKLRAWVDAGCPEKAGGEGAGTAKAPDGAPSETDEGGAPPPAPVADLGYAEVQTMLAGLGKKPTTVPHGEFWKKAYSEFVSYRLPPDWGEEDTWYPLLVPYDAASSNLIKVLKDGKGVTKVHSDGTVETVDLPRMPKNSAAMSAEDLARLSAWIDAGCPEFAGKPSALPRPGTSGPDDFAPEGPAPDDDER